MGYLNQVVVKEELIIPVTVARVNLKRWRMLTTMYLWPL
jgi:hypothetical protein